MYEISHGGHFDRLIETVRASIAAETDLVDVAMQRVEAAEKQLKNARAAASKAFEAAGKGTDGMFAESAFVPRKTAQKWREEARREQVKTASPKPDLWDHRAADLGEDVGHRAKGHRHRSLEDAGASAVG